MSSRSTCVSAPRTTVPAAAARSSLVTQSKRTLTARSHIALIATMPPCGVRSPLALPLLSLLLAALCALPASARFQLPGMLSSHMVLQRDSLATVWGWTDCAATNNRVGISIDDSSGAPTVRSAVNAATADGAWSFDVGALVAANVTRSYTLSLSDCDATFVLSDVLFGDVLLCAGQSNMEMTLQYTFDAAAAIADSANYPGIRMFTVARAAANTPMDTLHSRAPNFAWVVSGPAAFQGDYAGTTSALCFYTGRQLYNSTLGRRVPVGLVVSAVASTPIEAWSSSAALAACPSSVQSFQSSASLLWNAMIWPLRRMSFKMAVWYQGEQNIFETELYRCRFPAMIQDWRRHFAQQQPVSSPPPPPPALPFFFVQLAAYPDGGLNWPAQQLAQLSALSLPFVDFASALDLGDPFQFETGSVHPRDKLTIGRRLTRVIDKMVYGMEDTVSAGPAPRNISISATSAAAGSAPSSALTIVYEFNASLPLNFGLRFAGTEGCGACCTQPPFLLVDSLGHFHRADSAIVTNAAGADGRSVITVTAQPMPEGTTLAAVTYAYQSQSELRDSTHDDDAGAQSDPCLCLSWFLTAVVLCVVSACFSCQRTLSAACTTLLACP